MKAWNDPDREADVKMSENEIHLVQDTFNYRIARIETALLQWERVGAQQKVADLKEEIQRLREVEKNLIQRWVEADQLLYERGGYTK